MKTEIRKQRNIPSATGVMITAVYNGSAAAKYGIKPNDVILEINGEKVTSAGSFVGELAAKKTGDVLNLKVYSNGTEKTLNVKLEPFNYQNARPVNR